MAVAPSTPSCPKPQMQRPTLLRSRVEGCKSKSETLTVPFPKLKPEIDTNLLAFELIQDALTEDAKDAGDEMDDDVLSLCGQSESEEEEGNLVDLAYDFAKNVVGQGIALDFTKVIQNAVHENIASSDFLEVDDFNDDEVTEELGGMEPGHFVFEQDGADPVETARAQELADGLQSIRANAKQTLLRAAGDGSLFRALKAVEEARIHREDQVETLRREARDAMLKAACNGYLASALIKMRKVGQVSEVDKASENLVVENVKHVNVNVESSQLISSEVDVADQADQVSKHSEPVRENTAGTYAAGTSRAMKLAWSMAGSPARSLRQKEARKLLHSREAGRPSLTAYPFSSERVAHVTHMNEKSKDAEPSPSQRPEKSALTIAVGQPRLSGSASAMSLGLKRAKVVSVRCASRCASVGSLRPLKVKGPAPPPVPPTAFLQKQEPAKQGN